MKLLFWAKLVFITLLACCRFVAANSTPIFAETPRDSYKLVKEDFEVTHGLVVYCGANDEFSNRPFSSQIVMCEQYLIALNRRIHYLSKHTGKIISMSNRIAKLTLVGEWCQSDSSENCIPISTSKYNNKLHVTADMSDIMYGVASIIELLGVYEFSF